MSSLDNIILIGMPGAGKSTVGVLLAKTLGKDFIDTDLAMQTQSKMRLPEILSSFGYEGFLKIEENVLVNLDAKNSIIATGGSAVYSDAGIAKLKENGRTVFLDVKPEVLLRRLPHDLHSRGVVSRSARNIYDLYLERLPLYQKYADIIIECSGFDPASTSNKISESCL